MTNDRRKTFNTPLEFWQWCLGQPNFWGSGKRKARNLRGELLLASLEQDGSIYMWRSPQRGALLDPTRIDVRDCPLTAVEDEHGVIPEDESTEAERAFMDELNAKRDGFDIRLLTKLIDERIAAATVWQESMNGLPEEMKHYRLKPKGD